MLTSEATAAHSALAMQQRVAAGGQLGGTAAPPQDSNQPRLLCQLQNHCCCPMVLCWHSWPRGLWDGAAALSSEPGLRSQMHPSVVRTNGESNYVGVVNWVLLHGAHISDLLHLQGSILMCFCKRYDSCTENKDKTLSGKRKLLWVTRESCQEISSLLSSAG